MPVGAGVLRKKNLLKETEKKTITVTARDRGKRLPES